MCLHRVFLWFSIIGFDDVRRPLSPSTLSSCRVSGCVGTQHSEAVGPLGWRVDGRSASELQRALAWIAEVSFSGMRTLLVHGRAIRAPGVSVPLFSEEVQQGRILGRHEPHPGYHVRDLCGDANSLGCVVVTTIGAHPQKSATGGICETECISTNVDERVGHSVTWCFRFPLHARVCMWRSSLSFHCSLQTHSCGRMA